MTRITTHSIEVPGAVVVFDVREPEAPNEHRPLFVLGSPMAASGFGQLIAHIDDRMVITYDPRGTERSTLGLDGQVSVAGHADDLHRVVETTGLAPVDVFASSGRLSTRCAGSSTTPATYAGWWPTSLRWSPCSRTARQRGR